MGSELGVDEKMPILRKNRLSTGVLDLDIVLEGGYSNPGNIMIIGPSSIEKKMLAYHFAAAADGKKENSYIICGDSAPDDVIKKAASNGINLDKENVYFIDCYSQTLHSQKAPKPTEKISIVPGPSALNDLSLALNDAMKTSEKKRIRIIFDTLSTFALYNPKDSIKKFLDVVCGRLKNANATGIYLIEDGVHDKQLLGRLEHGMDEKYKIADKGGDYILSLPVNGLDVPFRLGPSGISII